VRIDLNQERVGHNREILDILVLLLIHLLIDKDPHQEVPIDMIDIEVKVVVVHRHATLSIETHTAIEAIITEMVIITTEANTLRNHLVVEPTQSL
jgi:hypothetical protein